MDCFAGSGTTLVAANDLNRNWIGVDIGNEAIKVVLNRFQNGTKTLDEHINNKKETKYEMLSLFLEQESENDNQIIVNNISSHLIDNYTIFANGNHSGMEFCLPQVLNNQTNNTP
jgi:adenine-specific DNA-methyltransferase